MDDADIIIAQLPHACLRAQPAPCRSINHPIGDAAHHRRRIARAAPISSTCARRDPASIIKATIGLQMVWSAPIGGSRSHRRESPTASTNASRGTSRISPYRYGDCYGCPGGSAAPPSSRRAAKPISSPPQEAETGMVTVVPISIPRMNPRPVAEDRISVSSLHPLS